MRRQKGMSSLLLVLLMLVLGSLTLQGTSIRHQAQVSQAALEKAALTDSANVESLLEWGRMLSWAVQPADQCQTHPAFKGRICLRLFVDGSGVLIANSGEQTRWQMGMLTDSTVQFDRHGWSDFCPLKEAVQCQLP
ncbi:DUF2509 family protein [Pseudescherichia vulneris]